MHNTLNPEQIDKLCTYLVYSKKARQEVAQMLRISESLVLALGENYKLVSKLGQIKLPDLEYNIFKKYIS